MKCNVAGCSGCSCDNGEFGRSASAASLLDREIVDDFGMPAEEDFGADNYQSLESAQRQSTKMPGRKVIPTVGKINPEHIKAIALPKMIYAQSLALPTSEKEKSAISFTINHTPEATALVLEYARLGVPGQVITIKVVDEATKQESFWTFEGVQVYAIDFDSFTLSEDYSTTNDFKCDFQFTKLDIKHRSI